MEKNENEKNIPGKLKDLLGLDSSIDEQIEKMAEDAKKLQNDIDFYKAMIKSADALKLTMEMMKAGGREDLTSTNLANVLTGTLLMLEREGFIKIIRNGKIKK